MTTLSTDFPIKLVHLTDTHLYGAPAGTLLKMNTQCSFEHVVSLIADQEADSDLILATGDIAQDGSPSAYVNFIQTMSRLQTPFRWLPGNHDNLAAMNQAAAGMGVYEKIVQINNWLLVFLDTCIDGEVCGELPEHELHFLEKTLASTQQDDSIAHCLLCLHHNPLPANSEWMKDIGLKNPEDLFSLLQRFQKVNSLIYGHIHQEVDVLHGGVRCLCSPSTCIQFKPNVSDFELDVLDPGYRSLRLFEDGRMDTEVFRLIDYSYSVDRSSLGY